MKTDLKLVKREGDLCVGGVWDICVLHVESLWITASASTAAKDRTGGEGGGEGSLGASEYQPRGVLSPTSQLLFLFANMADAVGEYSITLTLRPNDTNNDFFLQLILLVVIEVTTPFYSFSLTRHDPLMVHSTRTS
jgi:hypothetical protein